MGSTSWFAQSGVGLATFSGAPDLKLRENVDPAAAEIERHDSTVFSIDYPPNPDDAGKPSSRAPAASPRLGEPSLASGVAQASADAHSTKKALR
jgi:hypothetical protein